MNIKLGTPYEATMKKIIEKGYAGSQTEVIRQALTVYERMIDEEEVRLVNKGIAAEMEEIRSGKLRVYTHEQVKKKFGL
jgi:Arc/MetJ-type ribon-helix-helix transcriptional regulator